MERVMGVEGKVVYDAACTYGGRNCSAWLKVTLFADDQDLVIAGEGNEVKTVEQRMTVSELKGCFEGDTPMIWIGNPFSSQVSVEVGSREEFLNALS
jgi:hypothetical protein